jgi:hypothetical protein
MMIEVTYQKPSGVTWSVTNMFDKFYNYLSDNYECKHNPPTCVGYGSPNSPHHMTIKNLTNNKYFVVSYWDYTSDIYNPNYGWDVGNMVELFTSSGVIDDMKFTPFSYMAYSTEFEDYSNNIVKFDDKPNNELMFRGFFHGMRLKLHLLNEIPMTQERISFFEYFTELTNNKICLSLNGVAEICNRDLEILSSGSVLLRPLLKQKFHNELIPNVHYIPFEESLDPVEQMKIIKEKYNEIKDNNDLLREVSKNGHEWYIKNGTTQSNVDILKNILNIDLII